MTAEHSSADHPARAGAARAFREEGRTVLATLIRHVGDFQLAEDALQDAFATAVETWVRNGVPDDPRAWLTTAARRKAIDRLRRDQSVLARAGRLAELVRLESQDAGSMNDESALVDDRLRLIFTWCHPALDISARVALTLRALGGLTTGEIARGFLVSEPTMERGSCAPSARSPRRTSPTRFPPAPNFRIGCRAY